MNVLIVECKKGVIDEDGDYGEYKATKDLRCF